MLGSKLYCLPLPRSRQVVPWPKLLNQYCQSFSIVDLVLFETTGNIYVKCPPFVIWVQSGSVGPTELPKDIAGTKAMTF